jgi:hypothetical protein
MSRLLMRVFSIGLRSLVDPWAKAGPLKGPRSRWTGIPQYPEHRHVLISTSGLDCDDVELEELDGVGRFMIRGGFQTTSTLKSDIIEA